MARIIFDTEGKFRRGPVGERLKDPHTIGAGDIARWIKLADMAVTSPTVVGVAQLAKKGVGAATEAIKGAFADEAEAAAPQMKGQEAAARKAAEARVPAPTGPAPLEPAKRMPSIVPERVQVTVKDFESVKAQPFREPKAWRPAELAVIIKQMEQNPQSGLGKVDYPKFSRYVSLISDRQRQKPLSREEVETIILREQIGRQTGRDVEAEQLEEVAKTETQRRRAEAKSRLAASQSRLDEARARRAAPAAPAEPVIGEPIVPLDQPVPKEEAVDEELVQVMSDANGDPVKAIEIVKQRIEALKAQPDVPQTRLARESALIERLQAHLPSDTLVEAVTDRAPPTPATITPDIRALEETPVAPAMPELPRTTGIEVREEEYASMPVEQAQAKAVETVKEVIKVAPDNKPAAAKLAKAVAEDNAKRGVAAPSATSLAQLAAQAQATTDRAEQRKILEQVEALVPPPQPTNLFEVFGLGTPKEAQVLKYQKAIKSFFPVVRRVKDTKLEARRLDIMEKRIKIDEKRIKAMKQRWEKEDTKREERMKNAKKRLSLAVSREARAKSKEERLRVENRVKNAVKELRKEHAGIVREETFLRKEIKKAEAAAAAPKPKFEEEWTDKDGKPVEKKIVTAERHRPAERKAQQAKSNKAIARFNKWQDKTSAAKKKVEVLRNRLRQIEGGVPYKMGTKEAIKKAIEKAKKKESK